MRGCRPFSESEVQRITRSFSGRYAKRDRALFILGVRSGLRISELLSLELKDVLSPRGGLLERVYIRRKHTKGKTSGRSVVLHPEAISALAEWILVRKATRGTHVFHSQKNSKKPLDRRSAWRILNDQFVALRLPGPLGTHSMRKTFAAKVFKNLGRDLFKTQRALGHRHVTSTTCYLSFDEREIDRAILAS